eukprot:517573-Pyramimonas_sp.AAC.1
MCKEQGKGKSKDQVAFDPNCWQPKILDKFLNNMDSCNHRAETRSRRAGAHVDWDREKALHQD